jgi:adenosylcobalamin-dependent ribonucleoside-triphosphate reductase
MQDQIFAPKELNASKFKLKEHFIQEYRNQQPDWGPIGYITYKRTYARVIPEENRSEEWWETVRRVVEGTYTIQRYHCKVLGVHFNANKAQKSAQEMYKLIWDFKFLPPGRGLWMMGTEFVWKKGGAALNNCSFVSTKSLSTDFADPFCFLMDMSMLGVGVGGDTKGAGKVQIRKPKPSKELYTVLDTREGWVQLVKDILNSYVGKGMLPSNISYDNIRTQGVPIKGFGGVSSGPKPLMQIAEDIQTILDPMIGKQIDSTSIVDIFNCIGRGVVSGGVRRSAQIMFGESTDKGFLELKNPDISGEMKERLENWRFASNNSVIVKVGDDYSHLMPATMKNGEPGYFWLQTAREYGRMCDPPDYKDMLVEGANPCSEQSLESYELCCLVETFPARHETLEEYKRTLKLAYLYAKTVTLVKTHNERTNAVMLRNRRIGTSQSGVSQSLTRHGIREHFRWCDEGYKYTRDMDKLYSRFFCVPESIKVTSVKPSGSISLLPGATHGIHYPLGGEYYFRTIRFDKRSPITETLRKAGYRIEEGETESMAVVYFPIKTKNFTKSIHDVTIWEQVEIAAQMQHYWADNQVSVTVMFHPHEAKDIKKILELYECKLKSICFLPHEQKKEHEFKHLPYQKITKKEYEEAIKPLKPYSLREEDNINTEAGGAFCDSDRCEI